MCGILGAYTLENSSTVHPDFFENGLRVMHHRGPDAQGLTRYDERVQFGHLRLSIIDTREQANMPMETERSSMIFNGEIYNYLELKKDWPADSFKTTSDTEVLQRGLEQNDKNFLNRLNGMFAFAWYDRPTQRLLLVRDRYGVKPLYYCIEQGILYFSSEIKPLLRIMKSPRKEMSYYQNFVEHTATDYDQTTSIAGIMQIEPGHYVQCTPQHVEVGQWYYGHDFEFDPAVFKYPKETLRFTEQLLTESIKLRLRSDVPVCITLSGGLDSTVLYTLMKEHLDANITPFTFANPESRTDETILAERLASHYNDTVQKVYPDHAVGVQDMQEALNYLEFPTWGPSVIAYMNMYKHIHEQGYKVVLEGHGSDEQLGGYPFMIESAIYEALRSLHWRRAYHLLKVYQATERGDTLDVMPDLHNKAYSIWLRGRQDPNFFKTLQSACDDSFHFKILPIVLRTFDRLTMRSSLESRSPYMDYRVVEFFRALPSHYKVNQIGSKAILRNILKHYGHDYIYQNKVKQGFSFDEPQFFNQPTTRSYITQLISDFTMPEFQDLKSTAEHDMQSATIEWKHCTTLWKVSSLSYINTLYGL